MLTHTQTHVDSRWTHNTPEMIVDADFRRVHLSEKTLSFLNGEFEVEPAFGEKREEALRIAGLKTFFISKVLKPVSRTWGVAEGEKCAFLLSPVIDARLSGEEVFKRFL